MSNQKEVEMSAKERTEYRRLTKKLLFTLDLSRKELDRYMVLRVKAGE
jgi:hypothetical protein